jgi:two-component system, sensor histidine kinase LadS
MPHLFSEKISEQELIALFTNDEKCLEFLSDLKWDKGFRCRKCGNDNYCTGKTPFSRRCTKCKTEESATTGTLFHNCKFPISKAFYIAWNVCKNKEDVSTYEFARKLALRQMTCWKFKAKIKESLKQLQGITDGKQVNMQDVLMKKIVN